MRVELGCASGMLNWLSPRGDLAEELGMTQPLRRWLIPTGLLAALLFGAAGCSLSMQALGYQALQTVIQTVASQLTNNSSADTSTSADTSP